MTILHFVPQGGKVMGRYRFWMPGGGYSKLYGLAKRSSIIPYLKRLKQSPNARLFVISEPTVAELC